MPTALARRRLFDVGAVAAGLVGVAYSLGPSRPVLRGEASGWWWIDLVGGVLAAALLLARRRHPVPVAVVVCLVATPLTTTWLSGLVATFTVATRRRWPVAAAVAVAALGLSPVQWPLRATTPESHSWGALGYAVAVSVAVVAGGAAIRERRLYTASLEERAERAERETALRAEAARAAERTRIAREMHDVLGHRLSLVSMHAAALTHRRSGGDPTAVTPAETDAALEVIHRGTREALDDLRAILGVLRDPDGERAAPGREPPPTLADLDRLVTGVREAGTEVRLRDEVVGGAAAVPAEAGRTLYRVLQESLTNAARHAPGRPVDVRFRGRADGDVELDVRNPRPTADTRDGPPGTGLLGLTERVTLAGGTVRHRGPDGDAFRVAVHVPCAPTTRSAASRSPGVP